MANSHLTAERLRELLNYDPETGVFTWAVKRGGNGAATVKPGDVAGCLCKTHGYVIIRAERRSYPAHRLAWLYTFGKWPEHEIDHINGNRSDNRLVNLRDVTRLVNTQNRRTGVGKSGLLGAYWFAHARLWMSKIRANGKENFLGYFKTPEEAHAAYLAAKRKLHEGCTI